jgi:hypothetical protein
VDNPEESTPYIVAFTAVVAVITDVRTLASCCVPTGKYTPVIVIPAVAVVIDTVMSSRRVLTPIVTALVLVVTSGREMMLEFAVIPRTLTYEGITMDSFQIPELMLTVMGIEADARAPALVSAAPIVKKGTL